MPNLTSLTYFFLEQNFVFLTFLLFCSAFTFIVTSVTTVCANLVFRECEVLYFGIHLDIEFPKASPLLLLPWCSSSHESASDDLFHLQFLSNHDWPCSDPPLGLLPVNPSYTTHLAFFQFFFLKWVACDQQSFVCSWFQF